VSQIGKRVSAKFIAGPRQRVIFAFAAGVPTVFSKRSVFELIEDESGSIVSGVLNFA
jgi:hypothetical protein